MARLPTLYVDDILEALKNIEADIADHDIHTFRADRRARQLVERNLEIISEASRHLPDSFKDEEDGINWRGIADIGNVLRHQYHDGDAAILWRICHRDLKPLKSAVTRIRRALSGPRGA